MKMAGAYPRPWFSVDERVLNGLKVQRNQLYSGMKQSDVFNGSFRIRGRCKQKQKTKNKNQKTKQKQKTKTKKKQVTIMDKYVKDDVSLNKNVDKSGCHH